MKEGKDNKIVLLEDDQLEDLFVSLRQRYGYDFTGYAKASIKRRVQKFIDTIEMESVDLLKNQLLRDEAFFKYFLDEITVNVTEMFRDPLFFASLKKNVFPLLNTYPFIKIWDAGCSSGEELYSLAIFLDEEGLYGKSRIYATDISQRVLDKAMDGIYPIDMMKEYTGNYIHAGGKRSFSEYYTAMYGNAIFRGRLKKNVMFSAHNLAVDESFNEFNLIVCRNVLIYFNRDLQERVIELFLKSLPVFGFLALGNKETLSFSIFRDHFEEIDKAQKIYRRIN
ncbi:MAG: protein-glutamate O-methyltransferase CheR [Sporocytophaga sp.]|uniref:CheR family methyltransferase n=1 Tax=Sporocytophaga sp. TaxID=2231183 RepID=UPI001B1E9105|nr:protein-glutamate O-methyltransferase CheR [Sporocytophaga sp.]MBO9698649.1 protein-glutamate O-methyltransferase CheR [Sporocytophaga sp.]